VIATAFSAICSGLVVNPNHSIIENAIAFGVLFEAVFFSLDAQVN